MKYPTFELVLDHPRYKYRLVEPHVHLVRHYTPLDHGARLNGGWAEMERGGLLRFREGYMWNGPDVIRDVVNVQRASLVHDVLYQFIAAGHLPKAPWKKHADKEFHLIMRQDGVPGWQARYRYWAVRLFGGASGQYRP